MASLTSVVLLEVRNYEALSYNWGNMKDIAAITLNGNIFKVTTHLEVALRHLRRPDMVRRLWVDALCINQADNDERCQQVELMRFIYRQASRVLVWLGPAADDSDLAIKVLEEKAIDVTKKIQLLPDGPLEVDGLRAIYRLLQRSYWNRLWIIQEISVTLADPLVGCGQKWLPWSVWSDGLYHVKSHVLQWQRQLLRGQQNSYAELVKGIGHFDRFFNLSILRSDFLHTMGKVEKSNFVQLLRIGQHKDATDQRDHIYGFLGLTKMNAGIKFVPDYKKSIASVYRDAVKFAIQVENNLEVLELRNHLVRSWLPTWVPDFSAPESTRFPALSIFPFGEWRAGGDFLLNHLPKFSDDLKTLKVRGMVVDIIDNVVDLSEIENSPYALISLVHKTVLSKMPDGCSYLVDAIWRTLVGNSSVGNQLPCLRGYCALYKEVLRRATQGLNSPVEEGQSRLHTTPFLQAMYRAVRNYGASPHRRFFTTVGGLLGLGTPDCVEGDTVCVLRGYSMPVIMRSQENSYGFLGSAYVHGIMRGEALPSFSIGESDVEFTIT